MPKLHRAGGRYNYTTPVWPQSSTWPNFHILQDVEPGMGMDSPQSQTVRAGLLPHRWTRVDDPGAEAVVAALRHRDRRRRPRRAHGRLRAFPARQIVRGARGRPAAGRRHQPHRLNTKAIGSISAAIASSPRAARSTPSGARSWATNSSPARGSAGSTTTASSSTIRSSRWTPSGSWARGVPPGSCSAT